MKRTLKQGDIVRFTRHFPAHHERNNEPIEIGELFVIEEVDPNMSSTRKIRSLRNNDLLGWGVSLTDRTWFEEF